MEQEYSYSGLEVFLSVFTFYQEEDKDTAVNLFNTLVPVATGIIAFWFGGRGGNPEAWTS